MTSARQFQWIDEPPNAPRPEDLILCENGILNVATMELLELTGDYFATALPAWSFVRLLLVRYGWKSSTNGCIRLTIELSRNSLATC